jgi:hypothetical protein
MVVGGGGRRELGRTEPSRWWTKVTDAVLSPAATSWEAMVIGLS